MICKIADLITNIPAADGLSIRCAEYLYSGKCGADVTIRTDLYRKDIYNPNIFSNDDIAYMESAFQFYKALVDFDGFYLHASTVIRDGKAYLFSGHSTAGKSTHANLWISTFGGDTRIINDDKPALRCIDGVWYAYGTPWCGKDYINRNEKAPIAGVCFMKKAPKNKIRRLSSAESMAGIMSQTIYKFENMRQLDAFTRNLDDFLRKIPVFELENIPEPSAAQLCFDTINGAATEL